MTGTTLNMSLSYTGLLHLAKSPWHFMKYKQGVRAETQAMRMGTLLHLLVAEPHKFSEGYAVCDMRRDPRTEAYRAFKVEHEGKVIITRAENETASAFCAGVAENEEVVRIIKASKPEQAAEGMIDGVQFRGRADFVVGKVVADLKTARDITPDKWASKVLNERLHWQAYIYTRLFKAENFLHIAAESAAPYGTRVFVLGDEYITLAKQEIAPLLELYKSCLEKNEWPMPEATSLVMPYWAASRINYDNYEQIEELVA
jgi:hypothetical protein